MLQAKSQTDPIVEILRLAYRRGLALRQRQEQTESTRCPENVVAALDALAELGKAVRESSCKNQTARPSDL